MKFKKVLIDLSGTLHVENAAINGAPGALNRLRAAGISVKFVTNTSKESCQKIYERLIGLGFDLEETEIWSAVSATKKLLINEQLNPLLMVEEDVLDDFKDIPRRGRGDYDSVVVGLSPSDFNYDSLTNASRILLKGGELIAMNKSRYFKSTSGLSLGAGCFVHGLEYSCECVAHVVGKPSEHFFRAALDDTTPEETIMIGDLNNCEMERTVEKACEINKWSKGEVKREKGNMSTSYQKQDVSYLGLGALAHA